MKNIIAHLNPQELMKPELISVLEHMEVLAGQGKLLAIDPLDNGRLKVLHQIMDTPSILNPKNAFNLTVIERSRIFLDNQVAKHENAILLAVDQSDTVLAEWKIREMQRLAEIFNQFDRKYGDRLNSIIFKIKEKVRDIVEKALERIKVSMKSGNELYKEDIDKMQEAHLFQR